MPLYDHFRPPIDRKHDWTSFHSRWAVYMADALNAQLPERFLAENQIHLGQTTEADVVEFDRVQPLDGPVQNGFGYPSSSASATAVATETVTYAPPEASATYEVEYDDAFEVKVYDLKRIRRVVAVIELVSPSNKDRPDERNKFAVKVLSYLKAGIGVVVVDIVTDKHFDLHGEVLRVGRTDSQYFTVNAPTISAVAYRPVHRNERNLVDTWFRELTVGSALPILPLALKGYGCVPLDLEATYSEACKKSRIP